MCHVGTHLFISIFLHKVKYLQMTSGIFTDVSYSLSAHTYADTTYVRQTTIDKCIDTGDLFC